MKRAILAAALSIAAGSAHAQGALLETFADVRTAPEARPSRLINPALVDITALLPPPKAQGETDTCTSWAVTYAAASANLRAKHPEQPQVALSPAFTYPLAGGSRFCRGLTSISKTLDMLRDNGALPLPNYAFDPGCCARQPTPAENARAAAYRISGWQKLDAHDLEAVKGQLAEHRPVIFAMPVGPAFIQHRGDGVFDRLETGTDTTGHAMVLAGYDDAKAAYRLMNSSGRNWGDHG